MFLCNFKNHKTQHTNVNVNANVNANANVNHDNSVTSMDMCPSSTMTSASLNEARDIEFDEECTEEDEDEDVMVY